jgi:hypothetical protein
MQKDSMKVIGGESMLSSAVYWSLWSVKVLMFWYYSLACFSKPVPPLYTWGGLLFIAVSLVFIPASLWMFLESNLEKKKKVETEIGRKWWIRAGLSKGESHWN